MREIYQQNRATAVRTFASVAIVLMSLAAIEKVHACAPPPYYDSVDVVIASIRSVSDGPATHGKPPRVVMHVEQTLAGEMKPGNADAVWNPPPEGFDPMWKEAEKVAWMLKPMTKPPIDKKFILFGGMKSEDGKAVFHTHGSGKFEFSDKKLWDTKRLLDSLKADSELRIAQKLAAEKEFAAKVALWKYQTAPETVAKWAGMANFVAVATVSSGNNGGDHEVLLDFSVERVLKGTKRPGVYVGEAYFVSIKVPSHVNQRLDRNSKYLLFLLDLGDDRSKKPVYQQIAGDGIAIAEDEMIEAVLNAIKK